MLDYTLRPDYRFVKFSDIKPGDKLIVKSLKWYVENKDEDDDIDIGSTFINEMSKFCGTVVTVERLSKETYYTGDDNIYDSGCEDAAIFIKEDDGLYTWSLGMFKGKMATRHFLEVE